ncbi:MAG TPA: phosphotransferase [Candidatus Binataceae bacterium]|nr:phosphotransferase [Candidatus Binataceae bacterium]
MPAATQVEARLSDYLGAEVDRFRVLASGWETTVFEFGLRRAAVSVELPTGRPLVLRFYHGPQATTKGSREYNVMQLMRTAGFPVPVPYVFHPDPAPLGAPFLIMERLEGGPLLRLGSFPNALKTFTQAFPPFVKHHTRLHRLNPGSTGIDALTPAFSPNGAAAGPLLDRMLATITARVERGPLPWLGPALQWALFESTKFRDTVNSVLHMDYHPLNVLVIGGRITGIIDWVSAEGGDRHLDVATTATILSCHAMEHPRWLRDNTAGNTLRRIYNGLYLALYHAMMPLDFARLRYYQGLASIFRLSTQGMMLARGAESVGYRAEAVGEITGAVLELLARYATRKCRIPIVPPRV